MSIINITLPDSKTVSIRGVDVKIDFTKAVDPAGFAQRMFEYGFRKFNDAAPMGEKAPGKEASDEEKAAFAKTCAKNAEAMIADWLDGEFETERTGGGRAADPVSARARVIAIELVVKKYGKAPAKEATDAAKSEWAAHVKRVAGLDAVRAQAHRDVEAAKTLEIEI